MSTFITSLEETSAEASACRVAYDQSVDRLLREFHWPFAQAYVELALVSDETTTPWKTDWAYRYRYPSSAIAIRRIVTGLGRREPSAAPYAIGRDSDGKLIHADIEDAVADITYRETDPALFDPVFASAVSWHIASEICLPLSASEGLRKQALQSFMMDMETAKRIAVNEQREITDVDTELINSRFGLTASGSNDLTIYPSGFIIK